MPLFFLYHDNMTINHTIKIYDQSYVNFYVREHENIPLGYMTHYEPKAPAAFQKRKDSIDRSAAYSGRRQMNGIIIDNKPMIGFRISRSLRRLGWDNRNTYIRIEDPRGFEIDISVANMIMLTDNNLLENGEILRECVWGRDGNTNILLPVNSTPYMQAVTNTARVKSSVNSRTVCAGDHVILKNGREGRYMGALYGTTFNIGTSNYRYLDKSDFSCNDKKVHYIRYESEGGVTYYGQASPGISSVVKQDPLTPEQVNELILDDFNNKKVSQEQPGYNSMSMLSNKPLSLTSISLAPISLTDLMEMYATKTPIIYRSGFYGSLKGSSNLVKFDSANLGPMNSTRYIANVGQVNDSLFHGYHAKIIQGPGLDYIEFDRHQNSAYDPDEVDFFILTAQVLVAELNQTFTLKC